MAKDDKNRGQESKGVRRNKRRPTKIASQAILKLGPLPQSERTTSIKLQDAMDNEVKERLDKWRDDDDGRILIDMLVKSIAISNKYSLYNADGDWQCIAQGVGRALSGNMKRN